MDYIYIGKIVNTHGIKGELRILSNFERKDQVFKIGFSLYIGNEKRKEQIASYRHHKNFEMICYENITNINEVLKDIGKPVYINRKDLDLKEDDYLVQDLIGYTVIENKKAIGKIKNVVYNKVGFLLEVQMDSGKTFYVPKNNNFIKEVNTFKKYIETKNTKELIL